MASKNLIHLLHRRLVGEFLDDMYSPSRRRLEFYQWLRKTGNLSDYTAEEPALLPLPGWWSRIEPEPEPESRFEALIEQLRRHTVPASDEQREW